jgi:ADP-heptose:LPS heptosyltransferase
VTLLDEVRDDIRSLLVLRPGRIGDMVCALPALRALRDALPKARLLYVALPRVEPLLARTGLVDEHLAFPGFPGIAEQWFDPRATVSFLEGLQQRRIDLAVQLYGSGVHSNVFLLLAGARHNAGFVRPGDGKGLLDAAVELPATGHEIDRCLALPRALGAAGDTALPELALLPVDAARAGSVVAGCPRPLVALHATAGDDARALPVAVAAELARHLVGARGGTLVLVGGPGERERNERVASLAGVRHVHAGGRVDLAGLAALLRYVDVLVTSDSGPAHVSYLARGRSVTVYRASSPERWGPPRDPRHLAVTTGGSEDAPGDVDVTEVVRAADALLDSAPESRRRTGA